jgi:beta-lactamase regulating signal transducer with metallopeptidase domain
MSVWLTCVIVNAFGLSLLGLLAWPAIRLLRREPNAVYRFLVLVLALAVLIPEIQFVLVNVATAQMGVPEQLQPAPLKADLMVEVDLKVLHHGADLFQPNEKPVQPALAMPRQMPAAPEVFRGQALFGDYGQPLLLVYLAGALLMAVYQMVRLLRTAFFLAGCQLACDSQTLALWQEVAGDSPLRDRVRLLTSERIRFPCCWGLVRRYLVLPADLSAISVDALRWSLRHELVHLERGDARTALLQSLLLTIYWYHPAAWWLSRQLDLWRETSCDLAVVQRAGQRRSYALALVSFALSVSSKAGFRPALLHAASPGSQLRARVHMLGKTNQPQSKSRRRVVWSIALVMLGMIGLGQLGAAAALSFQESPSSTSPLLAGVRHEVWRSEEFKQVRLIKQQ